MKTEQYLSRWKLAGSYCVFSRRKCLNVSRHQLWPNFIQEIRVIRLKSINKLILIRMYTNEITRITINPVHVRSSLLCLLRFFGFISFKKNAQFESNHTRNSIMMC